MEDDGDIDTEFERPESTSEQSTKILAASALGLLAVYAADGHGGLVMLALALLGGVAGWLVADLVGDVRVEPLSLRRTPDGPLRIDGIDHEVDEHPTVVIDERVMSGNRNRTHNEFDIYWEPNRPPALDEPAPVPSEVEAAGMVETVTLAEGADSPRDALAFARQVARATDSALVWSQRDETYRWSPDEIDTPLVDRLVEADLRSWEALDTEADSLDIQPRPDGGVTFEWHTTYEQTWKLLGLGLGCGTLLGFILAADADVYWLSGMTIGTGLGLSITLVPAAILVGTRRHRGHRLDVGPDTIRKHHHLYGLIPTTETIEPTDIHHLRVERHLRDGSQLEAFGDDLHTLLGRRADVSDLPLRDIALCGLIGCAGTDARADNAHHW